MLLCTRNINLDCSRSWRVIVIESSSVEKVDFVDFPHPSCYTGDGFHVRLGTLYADIPRSRSLVVCGLGRHTGKICRLQK